MKKLLSLTLSAAMCIGLIFAMTGCSNKAPYGDYDLKEYITLPDYNTYEVKQPDVSISDEDVQKEIDKRLDENAKTEKITEGKVDKGDNVTIAFKGTLEDGSSPSGMNSSGYTLTLGEGKMIAGFEEGIYGAAIGESVTLDLKFPDPYQTNTALSGKPVTFEITVMSKNNKIAPALDEDFVKANSDYKTVEEYRAGVRKELEQNEYDEQLFDIKSELYTKIVKETEVKKYPEKEIQEQIKVIDKSYHADAEKSGYEWKDYLTVKLEMKQEQYDEQLEVYAQEFIKQEMVIYLISQEEKITLTDKEYDEYLQNSLKSSGFEDEKAFKDYTGMSLKEYAKQLKLDRDLLLTKELDAIYDRLTA